MFSKEKQQIIEYGILLDRYELVSLTCGNLAIRMPTGEVLITPSGMAYDKMVEDDVIVCDLDGNIIEGDKKPSSDTPAILYIQTYATHQWCHSYPPTLCYSYIFNSWNDRIQSMLYRHGKYLLW